MLTEPRVQSCWASAAKVLENELTRLQSSWPDPLNTMEVRADLESLLFVMTKLGAKFPLVGESNVLRFAADRGRLTPL